MKLAAVVVCYEPQVENLINLLVELSKVSVDVVLVDNSKTNRVLILLNEFSSGHINFKYLWMGENLGIASAQNRGIIYCSDNFYDAIFFFDQDSVVTNEMLNALIKYLPLGHPFVLGPVCLDRSSGAEMPSFKLNDLGLPVKTISSNHIEPYFVNFIISSGSLVTIQTFDCVGLMDESLFIDFVDFEWCARCFSRKVPVMVVPTAKMIHQIGQKSISFGVLNSTLHSPQRTYYKIRNPMLLLRNQDIPKSYVIKEILASWVSFLVIMIVCDGMRIDYFKFFCRGIFHGIFNKSGALNQRVH